MIAKEYLKTENSLKKTKILFKLSKVKNTT